LLNDDHLAASSVVANCAMNRERQLSGVNSYTKELGFNPLDVLLAGRAEHEPAGWLDLCCGTGRALIQAAERLTHDDRVDLVGVDLVDAFDPRPAGHGPRLFCAPLPRWRPDRHFDLITCVHGMHYLGDKLALLAAAARWLTQTGRFVADLDLSSIRLATGQPAGRRLATRLRAAGFSYDSRRHRISRTGPGELRLPYRYLGADDHAGANYTGQPAVHSYYIVDSGSE
jgi:SAM-dependent methyltransferase